MIYLGGEGYHWGILKVKTSNILLQVSLRSSSGPIFFRILHYLIFLSEYLDKAIITYCYYRRWNCYNHD